MPHPTPRSLLSHFAGLEDPRQHAKVLYPLVEILLLALSATVAGADDFVEGRGEPGVSPPVFPVRERYSRSRHSVRRVRGHRSRCIQSLLPRLD